MRILCITFKYFLTYRTKLPAANLQAKNLEQELNSWVDDLFSAHERALSKKTANVTFDFEKKQSEKGNN